MGKEKIYVVEKGSCRGDSFGNELELSVDKVKSIYNKLRDIDDVCEREECIEDNCEGAWFNEAQYVYYLCFEDEELRDIDKVIEKGEPIVVENEESAIVYSFKSMENAKATMCDIMEW